MEITKPIVFFDLETTGTNIIFDRIVQIAAMKMEPDGTIEEKPRKYLINPGIEIPAAATEIHGITNEMVKDKPLFKQLAKGFLQYIEGCDLAGFNILDFDVPLLAEEYERAAVKWNYQTTRFFDSFRIFRDKEKRDLTAAVKFYLNEDHGKAHDAGEDVLKTANVFLSQLKRYDDLHKMAPNELADYCAGGRAVDLCGKIVLNDAGVPVYSFGKSKDRPVVDDKGFANWMLKSDFTTDTKNIIKKLLGYGN